MSKSLIPTYASISMNPNTKMNLILFLIALILIIVSLSSVAFGELEIDTIITDKIIIVSGFFDEDYVAVVLKQNGMHISMDRVQTEFGHYYAELQIPRNPGTYELTVGSATSNETIEILIGIEPLIEEIEIEDTPYGGQVIPASIETPELEELLVNGIPSWVRDVFLMWVQGSISDMELIASLEYLIKTGVIVI